VLRIRICVEMEIMCLSSGVHEHRYEIVYRSHVIIVKENLLHYMFRDKDKLISPMSMHLHFGIRNLDYDERKERTIKV